MKLGDASRRRWLMTLGLSAAAVAALATVAAWPDGSVLDDDGQADGFLRPADRAILAALAPAMLGPAWPAQAEAAAEALRQMLRGIDTALLAMPPRVRDDMRTLFDLLGRQGGRVLATGSLTAWDRIDAAAADRILQHWRDHPLPPLQQAYGGLHDLIMGVWYGDPAHFADCGYSGPPTLEPGA
jgi:hypothetical protein